MPAYKNRQILEINNKNYTGNVVEKITRERGALRLVFCYRYPRCGRCRERTVQDVRDTRIGKVQAESKGPIALTHRIKSVSAAWRARRPELSLR